MDINNSTPPAYSRSLSPRDAPAVLARGNLGLSRDAVDIIGMGPPLHYILRSPPIPDPASVLHSSMHTIASPALVSYSYPIA